MYRKEFLKKIGFLSAGAVTIPGFLQSCSSAKSQDRLFFNISLAEWSLHRSLFDGKMDNLDFPATAKNEFGITAVEYVNQFFKDKAKDTSYLDEMNNRCDDLGVDQLLIMIDGEGAMAGTDEGKRKQAIENHYKWVEAAEYLGCHSIRVNARGDGSREEQKKAAVDGLGRLSEFAEDYDINIIVENHGGYSSDGQWLTEVIAQVDMDNCGTLPDFGNFCIESNNSGCGDEYDRYKGVRQMMPYAKGVSAKAGYFNEEGMETRIDYSRMLNIVKESGYSGYIGIEYSGDQLSEYEGITATKKLLERVGAEISNS